MANFTPIVWPILAYHEAKAHLMSIIFISEYFEEQARGLGINSDTHVVIYCGDGTNGFYFGGRGWWMFYVSSVNCALL